MTIARRIATTAALLAALGAVVLPATAGAATTTTQNHTYRISVNPGILAGGQNTITARVKVSNPEPSVRDFWSRATVQQVVRQGVDNGYQKPYMSEGFRCTPTLDGSMNASTARFTCKLQGADVPTAVTLTFTAPYLPPTALSAPAPATGPQISAGTCKVRSSHDEGQRFTYADCEIAVNNVPVGQSVKVAYKSNLKTFTPRAEFGPWDHTSGTVTAANPGGMPGQTAGTTADLVVDLQLAFPGKSVAQVKQDLKVTLSSATHGATVTDAVATASR